MELKRLDREDRFRYFHPHLYVDLDARLPVSNPLMILEMTLIVGNRDQRDINVKSIEWEFNDGSSWPIEDLNFNSKILKTSEVIKINLNLDNYIFRFSSQKATHLVRNILDLSIKVKLETDKGRIFPVDHYMLKRALVYKYVKSYFVRKYGGYLICRRYNFSLIHVFIK